MESKPELLFPEKSSLLSAYDYELPPRLIAQSPLADRGEARLMVIDRATDSIRHLHIRDFASLLRPEDAIVLNDTKVLPARLIGFRTSTGGRWEGLFLRFLPNGDWEIMSKTRGKLRVAETLTLERPSADSSKSGDSLKTESIRPDARLDDVRPTDARLLEVVGRTDEKTLVVRPFFPDVDSPRSATLRQNSDEFQEDSDDISFDRFKNRDDFARRNEGESIDRTTGSFVRNEPRTSSDFLPHTERIERSLKFLEEVGWVPIPPYIRAGRMIPDDRDDYQTVFAREPGAVAAPTAGLHFSQEALEAIRRKGIAICPLTLHVGAGTFKPIAVERLSEHKMHSEFASLSTETVERLLERRRGGGRIVAIGTTTVRTLESASNRAPDGTIDSTGRNDYSLQSFQGYTDLFIRPPYQFKTVDAMLTNFHLPKSTLLVLVRTFGGDKLLERAYQEAIEREYRFYSYGDAMIIF